jgi:hypothetical protein
VITGFNTDIEYKGVTYHVQTEDKGLDTPLILSLVYNRGTILASKRSPYNDLLLGEFNEKELSERLQRQHKLICAAIRAGRIEDLKQMNAKDAKNGHTRKSEKEKATQKNETPKNSEAVEEKVKKIEISQPKIELKPLAQITPKVEETTTVEVNQKVEETPVPALLQKLKENSAKLAPIQKPQIELPKPEFNVPPSIEKIPEPVAKKTEEVWDAPIEITDADLIFEDTRELDEAIVLPPEAVEILTDFSASPQNESERLFVELLNEVNFRGGESQMVSIMVGRGKDQTALVGANIMIKVLGTNFRPLIFHTKTDSNGVAIVNLQLPQFSRGRAAVLFKAMSNGEEAELRRVIQPGA